MLINERNRGNETSYFMCSFCRGTFAKSSIKKHKRICFVTEGTTLSTVSVPVTLMTDTGTVTFRDNILANFRDDVVGNLCRSEELIREFGEYHYKRAFCRKDKQLQIKQRVMSLMRMLGKLYIFIKDIAVRNNAVVTSAEQLFNRSYFNILEAALEEVSLKEDGTIKSGLKKKLGHMLNNVIFYLKGSKMIKKKDAEVEELEKFKQLLDFKWQSIFDAAEYNCKKATQEKSRKPARLPSEGDVKVLRDATLKEIERLSADEFHLLSASDFVQLRDHVCSRLTLFNARRGGEPSRLTVENWEEAKESVWVNTENYEPKDVLEKMLICRFRLAYQSGNHASHLVPDLIPEDCWAALDRLSDPVVRHAVGVSKENHYLFASTSRTGTHVIGWNCCDKACKYAGLKSTITATDMRHRASTLYAARDVAEKDREAFYRHMGHSADINRDVYQCPYGVKEILTVGEFLLDIDGTKLQKTVVSQEDEDQFEEAVTEINSEPSEERTGNDDVATTSGLSCTGENRSVVTELNLQAFLQPLVDEDVLVRATTGRALIDEGEVEVLIETLVPYSDILCNPALQRMAKPYFTEDGWLCVENTLQLLKEHASKDNCQRTKQKAPKRKCTPEAMEDLEDSFELNESDYSSEEDKETGKSKSEVKKSKPPAKERQYHLWKREDSEAVVIYFKQQIEDTTHLDSKGPLPSRFEFCATRLDYLFVAPRYFDTFVESFEIREFLRSHPTVFEDIPVEKDKIFKIKTKIFNERLTFRKKYKKKIEKHLF